MEEQLEQPPVEKTPTYSRQEQPENWQGNDVNLANSPVQMDKVLGTSTMDLATSRLPLPLELNCEIFKCLKLKIQRKFIWGLGRDIYGIFRQKLLKKTKRVRIPHGNRWNGITTTTARAAANGWSANYQVGVSNVFAFAAQPFLISGPQCRLDEFPGTILYYYEVKGGLREIGFSDGTIPASANNLWICDFKFSCTNQTVGHFVYQCWFAGERHRFELPEGIFRPRRNIGINVFGCGLVLDPEDKLCIFFTMNGEIVARKIPISPAVDRLFPAVRFVRNAACIETNFGDDPARPLKYNIKKCPGLGLACI